MKINELGTVDILGEEVNVEIYENVDFCLVGDNIANRVVTDGELLPEEIWEQEGMADYFVGIDPDQVYVKTGTGTWVFAPVLMFTEQPHLYISKDLLKF